MRKLLFYLLLSLGNIFVFSQSYECGMIGLSENSLQRSIPFNLLDEVEVSEQYILVKTHIVRENDSSGGVTIAAVNNAYSDAIEILSSNNSEINLIVDPEVNYIDNSEYLYISSQDQLHELLDIDDDYFRIDVYFVTYYYRGNGAAQDYGASDILIASYATDNTSTLAHEIGHCFGLYHTFHGTSTENDGDEDQCAELVLRTNCNDCGDYLCDTPADPKILQEHVNLDCNLIIPMDVDGNGQEYEPDPMNLMSYSRLTCRVYISPQQISVMQFIIQGSGIAMTEAQLGFANRPQDEPDTNYTQSTLDIINLDHSEFTIDDLWSGTET